MTLEEAMKMICDHRAKVKRTKDDWHDGYYDGLTAALMMLSEDKPADTDKPIWEAKDKITLEELAHELRKIFKFGCLTAEHPIHNLYFALWNQKPVWNGESWRPADNSDRHIVADFFEFEIVGNLDLSEYTDKHGEIDYSRCIVEVADDID